MIVALSERLRFIGMQTSRRHSTRFGPRSSFLFVAISLFTTSHDLTTSQLCSVIIPVESRSARPFTTCTTFDDTETFYRSTILPSTHIHSSIQTSIHFLPRRPRLYRLPDAFRLVQRLPFGQWNLSSNVWVPLVFDRTSFYRLLVISLSFIAIHSSRLSPSEDLELNPYRCSNTLTAFSVTTITTSDEFTSATHDDSVPAHSYTRP